MDAGRALRLALVRKLRRDGILKPGRVERAFTRVPRHVFVPNIDLDVVYRDTNIPTRLDDGEIVSSSSQPAIMAIMLSQLAARAGDHVLEVGAGTGYNAALLAEIVGEHGQVTTIDLDAETVRSARAALNDAGYGRVRAEQMDGVAGFPECAPYDRIMATVGLGDIPQAWCEQLKPGGSVVLPLSLRGIMKAVAFRKDARGRLISTSIKPASFMPFRGANPLSLREIRVGPELGLFAWFPPDRQTVPPTSELYRLLQLDPVDIPTGIALTRAEFHRGLHLWMVAHQPAVFALHVEGMLAELGPVPKFLRNQWAWAGARDRLTSGVWTGDEVALLARADELREDQEDFELVVRAFGGRRVADHLISCIEGWRRAGSPADEHVQLRLLARKGAVRSQATIPMPSGTLELTWHRPLT
ncbi:MAG: methyltransferase domain-containing protein [Chloroflexi bacterium]|nr:methyltransferase domain-containing protein [Chloroflexota bacterium]